MPARRYNICVIKFDETELALDGAGGPGRVERGLRSMHVLAKLDEEAGELRGSRGRQHLVEGASSAAMKLTAVRLPSTS